jgi:uncharacterized serine/threonine-protein kinase SgK494
VKTLWPIACREYLFLPEFKVHNKELENYEIIEFIAKGSFGKVWKVRERKTSQTYALKVLEKSKVCDLEPFCELSLLYIVIIS